MSQKRARPDVYRLRKKQNVGASDRSSVKDEKELESALAFLKLLFPVEKFERRLPVIIMKYQFYSIISNRTEVDKQLDLLQMRGKIRMFRLGQEDDQFAVVEMEDYLAHVRSTCDRNLTVENFLTLVVEKCADVSYTKESLLNKFGFTEEDITTLIRRGVLTVRDVGSLWLSIPGAGEFVKTLVIGRSALLSALKRTRYKELLQRDLEERKFPKKAKLTSLYYIHDLIGADLVSRFETSSGTMLRLRNKDLM